MIINTKTQKQYDTLIYICKIKGIRWFSEDEKINHWITYKKNTCVDIGRHKLFYAPLSYEKRIEGNKVISFKKWIKSL